MAESKISVVIVDEDDEGRRAIRELLKATPDTEILSEIPEGREAARLLVELDPELVFMSLDLGDGDAFGILEEVGDSEGVPVVVLTSREDASASRAFDTTAVDMILKPVAEQAFARALDRARARLRSVGSGPFEDFAAEATRGPEGDDYRRRLMVKDRDAFRFVSVEQVIWIEAEGNYARIHGENGTHLIRATLTDLANSLDPRQFMRVHRGSVVNLDRVESIIPSGTSDYRIILKSGKQLNVGRSFRDRLLGREDTV